MYNYHVINNLGYIVGSCGSPSEEDLLIRTDLLVYDGTDRINDMWDVIAKIWKPDDRPLPPETRLLSKIDFIELFTDAEMESLIDFAKTNTKAALFLRKLDSYEIINLNNTKLQAAITAMETVGVLLAGRASEIINSTSDVITVTQPPRI